MKTTLLLLWLLSTGSCLAQPAGYRSISLIDSARRYQPNARPGEMLYYRPVEIDYWYPAAASPTTNPVRFGEFLRLFQRRANSFQQDTSYDGLAAEMAQYLSAGLNMSDTAKLTGFPTHSYLNAPAFGKPPPLIIYLCSYNGMCYENIPLFETLAAHGYAVASITSVGRYPGNMTTNPADLFEQTADALFALRHLRQSGRIDPRILPGVVGYSWGGLAAIVLSMQMPSAAILSLDGSEMHYYGSSATEDSDFNRLRTAPFFHPADLHTPYAYLESGEKQSEHPADSIFNPHPTKYWRFPHSTHEDFSGLPTIATHTDPAWLPLAAAWFDHYLKGQPIQLGPDSSYPTIKPTTGLAVTATIIDDDGHTPVPFVNVGIPGKNLGTVTSENGRFALTIDPALAGDSLAISMVGYEHLLLPVKHLPKTIILHPNATPLTEAVVTARSPKIKRLGNTTTSRFMSVGFPLRFLGAEIGVRIRLGHQPVRLKAFHCNISESRVDTALFRLNIYSLHSGTPRNILRQNIFLPVGKRTGEYTIDLTAQGLMQKGEILVSLELIRGSAITRRAIPDSTAAVATTAISTPNAQPTPGALFFSASLLRSSTWRRQTSQAEWKKAGGIGVGFNLDVQ